MKQFFVIGRLKCIIRYIVKWCIPFQRTLKYDVLVYYYKTLVFTGEDMRSKMQLSKASYKWCLYLHAKWNRRSRCTFIVWEKKQNVLSLCNESTGTCFTPKITEASDKSGLNFFAMQPRIQKLIKISNLNQNH